GFEQPVDNAGVLNIARAGRAIPLKWQLLDARNNPVTTLTKATVTVQTLSCTSGTTTDNLEEYATGSSGLLNLGNGRYQFNWQPPSTYAGSCKTMRLDVADGVTHQALFTFTKLLERTRGCRAAAVCAATSILCSACSRACSRYDFTPRLPTCQSPSPLTAAP